MILNNKAKALIVAMSFSIGSSCMAREDLDFGAQDSISLLEMKASESFLGKTAPQMREFLQANGYNDAVFIDLSQSIEPGKSVIDDGATLTSNDIHLLIQTKKSSMFSLSSPRISIFLQMRDGVCRKILKVRKFAK